MQTKKKRLAIALDGDVQQRLKDAAARKGVSMAEYCRSAIDKEMAQDEVSGRPPHFDIESLIALRKKTYGDRVLPGSSVDLIREAREERDRHMAGPSSVRVHVC